MRSGRKSARPPKRVAAPRWRGEVSKAHARRLREGWHERFAPEHLPGIDIGCQHDPLNGKFRRYDLIFGDPDATFMADVADETYYTVHASHILEHLADPTTALRNWYRILAPGGHLIVLVPHRDLYEKSLRLPSKWNFEHKSYWLPDRDDPPDTRNFRAALTDVAGADLVSFRVLDDGWRSLPADVHPVGEFSIEGILRKPPL